MLICKSMHEQTALAHHHHDFASASTLTTGTGHAVNRAPDSDGCHHPLSKCSVCAACSMGVATVPAVILPLSRIIGSHETPSFATALHGTLPDALERPPRALLA